MLVGVGAAGIGGGVQAGTRPRTHDGPARTAALRPVPLPLVQPPGAPWLLGNTAPDPPHVTWSGPALMEVDAPEDLTASSLGRAPGGAGTPHLLYADGFPAQAGTVWALVYVENATAATPLRISLAIAPAGDAASVVAWGGSGGAGEGPTSRPLPAGESSVAGMFDATAPGTKDPAPVDARVPGGGRAVRSWVVPPQTVLSVWQPVSVTSVARKGEAFEASVWEGPVSFTSLPAHGSVLTPRPTDVVRTTVPHAIGTVTLPVAGSEATLWDLDNDSPTPDGQAGGVICPPWVCQNGEVRTYGDAGFRRGSDPLPGEYEAGTDPLDASGHPAAVAVMVQGRLIRTGNYGDYGSLLRVVLKAPPGRVVDAVVVPGFTHAVPWEGITVAGGRTTSWAVPTGFPPIGWGYEVAHGTRTAIVESTVTPGAYAPWRLAVWSEPAG